MVGEAVLGIAAHVGVVQHRRQKRQDRPHRQRHRLPGIDSITLSILFWMNSSLVSRLKCSIRARSILYEQWTWAATILQSSNVAWEYGVSGPFWYASGATIQVLLFGVMAIEIKRKAPRAHTVCEIARARYALTHVSYLTTNRLQMVKQLHVCLLCG